MSRFLRLLAHYYALGYSVRTAFRLARRAR